jgi:hypothetical protein
MDGQYKDCRVVGHDPRGLQHGLYEHAYTVSPAFDLRDCWTLF